MESDEGEAKVAQLANWRDSTLFGDSERIALDYAEHMTITGQTVDDARSRSKISAASSTRRSGSRRRASV